jgi:hypothetical protein
MKQPPLDVNTNKSEVKSVSRILRFDDNPYNEKGTLEREISPLSKISISEIE